MKNLWLSLRRITAVVLKECTQIERDPSILLIGLFLPLFLLMLFGYGLSMDVKGVPVAIVADSQTPFSTGLTNRFLASGYFVAHPVTSRIEAERLMKERKVDALLHIPADFPERFAAGDAALGLTVHGVDANQATMIRTYVNAMLAIYLSTYAAENGTSLSAAADVPGAVPALSLASRAWFNEANRSAWYLVPGLLIVTMTLVGSFLTSLVIAREWERGTVESLYTTPVQPWEMIVGKLIPNYVVALSGALLALCVGLWAFDIPVRGSIGWLLTTLVFYQLLSVLFGLFLSAVTKRQFLALQYAVIGSFLPALMLSGFLFDLRSVPDWIAAVGYLMPPTYAIESVKICFLSGGNEDVLAQNVGWILLWCLGFLLLTLRFSRKTLEGGLHV